MKLLSANQRKWLKSFHLLTAGFWVTSGSIILTFQILSKKITDGNYLYMLNYLSDFIDMKILVPSALSCLLTGLIYSLFTNWGFFKHRWLTFKWIVTVTIITMGTIWTGPWIADMTKLSGQYGMEVLKNDYYLQISRNQFIMGLFMNVTLIVTIFISVFKPWKKSKTIEE
ncbi:MAG TPA: hypothetical protein PKX79_13200 [Spirochaetota bacterium]|nr:hypothetical protein [Spirochaetota bacterium]HOK93781.1 hypothetical protein [Spirochaetota bacterium]HON16472.1 hypothetical protein [Spirochaetota bacterium]HPD77890.1 hypothetical protein [Spirochaetota bacterium]HPP96317.1 hypothetical protein [Spirochaetota bacterium]